MKIYFENLVGLMKQKHNLEISAFDESFLEKTVARRVEMLSPMTKEAYLSLIQSERSEALFLYESLSNCFSEFFRNLLTCALMEQILIPKIFSEKKLNHSREVRIWSAGCAAGQEAYSFAILANEYIKTSKADIGFTLFATDNSEQILDAARKGIYGEEAVRNVRLEHVNRYFTIKNDQYQLDSNIRDLVRFSFYDLLDRESSSPPASIYGDFDIVFCSNVLYYYNPEIQKRLLGKISRSLVEGGFLITSEAEKGIVKMVRGFRQFAPPAPVFVKTI